MLSVSWARGSISLHIALLVLTSLTFLPLPHVQAEVSIINLSQTAGFVGDLVELTGQINTTMGAYEVLFDGELLGNGSATLTALKHEFQIPNSTKGEHIITLRDVEENMTSDVAFTVKTQYVLTAEKARLQEGDNTTVSAVVTGGEAAFTLLADISIEDPSNVTYACPSFNITESLTAPGYGASSKVYPFDFGLGAHTYYVGTYNMTMQIGTNSTIGYFAVGLTDESEYHRFQVVSIKAANYTLPADVLQITIAHDTGIVFSPPVINASEYGGFAMVNWTIPAVAAIGTYVVTVNRTTPLGTEKIIPDNQTFTIVIQNFICEVKAFNIEDEAVRGILIEANNTISSVITNRVTNVEGTAIFVLEAATYVFTAELNTSKVGQIPGVINLDRDLRDSQALRVNCSLAHIRVAIKDVRGNATPFVEVRSNFTFFSRTGSPVEGTALTKTDVSGVGLLRNLFLDVNYTLHLSRYDQTFNTTEIELTTSRWFNTTVPERNLAISVLDRNGSPLLGVHVRIYDWGIGSGGLVGQKTTDLNGETAFNFTFGKYTVQVLKDNLLLNQTDVILANQPTNFVVHCKLYRLTLQVHVVDYFGQGISNANITIKREADLQISQYTGASGIARFDELVGGNYRVFVRINDRIYGSTTLRLEEPGNTAFRIEEIVSLGGLITYTSQFATALFLISAFVAFLLFVGIRNLKSRRTHEE